jgi:competence protein ComEC
LHILQDIRPWMNKQQRYGKARILHGTTNVSFGVRLSAVLVVGISFGLLSSTTWHIGGGVALSAAALSLAMHGVRSRASIVLRWLAIASVAVAYGAHTRTAAPPIPRWIFGADAPVQIEGRLQRDASISDAGVRLELTDVSVTGRHQVTLRGRHVLMTVGGTMAAPSLDEWSAGRRVVMPARLRPPAVIRNPGSPGVRWQEMTRPFDILGTVKSGSLVEVTPGGVREEAAAAVRRHVRRVARVWLAPLDAQSAAVVTAILIGDRAGLDDALTRRLQMAGTFHVIAISGGNVAVLTVLCLFVARLCVRRERPAVLATLMIVLAYGIVVGRDASVTRAVVAASLYLALRAGGLVPKPLNILALTALVCVVVDPWMVSDAGAWLSFGATFGLIAVLPRLMPRGRSMMRSRWRPALRIALGLLLATAAAEIMILPIAASLFMRVGIAGFPLNFVAIPAMTVAQISGLALCAVAPWWPAAAAVLALVAHHATQVLTGSSALVDVAPWVSWRVAPPPLIVVGTYYAAVLFAIVWSGRRALGRAAAAFAVAGVLAMVSAPWTLLGRPTQGWLRVTVLDVGQGEAVAIQFPNRRVLLMDAGGSAGAFDVGGRVVTPALWASGVRRLDWLAMTHGDLDHIGGVARVAEDLRPREFWEGVPVPGIPMLDAVRHVAKAGVWRRLFAGQQIEAGGASMEVLHPPVPSWERRRVRNDDSLVMRLRFGKVEVLLTGDAGLEFESAFTRDPAAPPIRLLKVAHHGSKTSSSDAFLDAYAPSVAIVSAGQNNMFGHPSPVVLERLRQRDVDVFRTDRDGAVVIETDGRVAHVRGVTGRVLTVMTTRTPT